MHDLNARLDLDYLPTPLPTQGHAENVLVVTSDRPSGTFRALAWSGSVWSVQHAYDLVEVAYDMRMTSYEHAYDLVQHAYDLPYAYDC